LCLLFLWKLRFSSIPTDKNLICTRTNFKQLHFHTHRKLDTCLYELIYSE